MSDSCCDIPARGEEHPLCPTSGSAGEPVDWMTVAALATHRVPPRQKFHLCRDAECDVVYYGSTGSVLTVRDLDVHPGFKEGSEGLVCYCFLHRKVDIARQLTKTGRTDVLQSIEREVRAGNCACEVRNPSGKCCLGEVQETIRILEKELGVSA